MLVNLRDDEWEASISIGVSTFDEYRLGSFSNFKMALEPFFLPHKRLSPPGPKVTILRTHMLWSE